MRVSGKEIKNTKEGEEAGVRKYLILSCQKQQEVVALIEAALKLAFIA